MWPAGAARGLPSLPQQATAFSVVTPHARCDPTLTEANSSSGGSTSPRVPQQTTAPPARTMHPDLSAMLREVTSSRFSQGSSRRQVAKARRTAKPTASATTSPPMAQPRFPGLGGLGGGRQRDCSSRSSSGCLRVPKSSPVGFISVLRMPTAMPMESSVQAAISTWQRAADRSTVTSNARRVPGYLALVHGC